LQKAVKKSNAIQKTKILNYSLGKEKRKRRREKHQQQAIYTHGRHAQKRWLQKRD
jgi:hypothetical protein